MPRRTRRHRTARTSRTIAIEHLEQRRVLATTLQAGIWTIRGDRDAARPDDVIVVDRNPADAAQLRAMVNGVVVGMRPESRVRVISVVGGRGDDSISIDVPGNIRLRTVLDGGVGNDTIVGGDGRDVVRGGLGADLLRGGGSRDELWGGGGDDDLAGGTGNDVLRGEAGRDTLRGGQGRNALYGGVDHDTFYGVAGVDEAVLAPGEELIGNESTNPLRAVSGSADLKSWFIDTALKQWGPHLGQSTWSPWYRTFADGGVVAMAAAGNAAGGGAAPESPASSGDYSGTNNQVAGVDEADLVKTDGTHLFVLAGDGIDIVRAWPAEELAVVSHLPLEGREQSLFLHGTTLTVLSQMDGWTAGGDVVGRMWWGGTWQPKVAVTVIDVADPSQPVVRERTEIDGWLVSARSIGPRVIVVAQDGIDIPTPGFVEDPTGGKEPKDESFRLAAAAVLPGIWFGGGSSYVYEDATAYRARLEAAWDAGVLPAYSIDVGGASETGLLVDAGHAYVPVTPQDAEFLSVVSFVVDDDAAGPDSVTSVGGANGIVYASLSGLYVASTTWGAWWDSTDAGVSTNVYAFDLTDASIPLVAMGAVDGMVLDQFSLDEHEGLLRIATTTWGSAEASESTSGISVLRARDGNLDLVGSVTGLAPGERIYSARFAGDQAYVSTFRQIDPFFVIDLADPTVPRVTGELKIPGFSSYLQRLDESHVLGVGRDVDPDTGRVLGIQLSLFDVSDPTDPRRVATHTFPGTGWSAWSEALWNHLAISWFPEYGILALPFNQGDWTSEPANDLVVLRVDLGSEPGFAALGTIAHGDPVRRSLRIGDAIYSISGGEVQVHRVDDPSDIRGQTPLADPPSPDVWLA